LREPCLEAPVFKNDATAGASIYSFPRRRRRGGGLGFAMWFRRLLLDRRRRFGWWDPYVRSSTLYRLPNRKSLLRSDWAEFRRGSLGGRAKSGSPGFGDGRGGVSCPDRSCARARSRICLLLLSPGSSTRFSRRCVRRRGRTGCVWDPTRGFPGEGPPRSNATREALASVFRPRERDHAISLRIRGRPGPEGATTSCTTS
jgi:hypothetical protein